MWTSGFMKRYRHCFTRNVGVLSKPTEELFFRSLISRITSFSVTGAINIVTGQLLLVVLKVAVGSDCWLEIRGLQLLR